MTKEMDELNEDRSRWTIDIRVSIAPKSDFDDEKVYEDGATWSMPHGSTEIVTLVDFLRSIADDIESGKLEPS